MKWMNHRNTRNKNVSARGEKGNTELNKLRLNPYTQTTDGKGIERITERSELTTENTEIHGIKLPSAGGGKGITELNKLRLNPCAQTTDGKGIKRIVNFVRKRKQNFVRKRKRKRKTI